MRVGGFVARGQDADVEDFGDAGVLLEVRFDGGAVGEAGVVAAEDDCHGGAGGHSLLVGGWLVGSSEMR